MFSRTSHRLRVLAFVALLVILLGFPRPIPVTHGTGFELFAPPRDLFDLNAIENLDLADVAWQLAPSTFNSPNPYLDEENGRWVFKGTFNLGSFFVFPIETELPGGGPLGSVSLSTWETYLCEILWEATAHIYVPVEMPDQWGPTRRYGWVGAAYPSVFPDQPTGQLSDLQNPFRFPNGGGGSPPTQFEKEFSAAKADLKIPTIDIRPETLDGIPMEDAAVLSCGTAYGGNCPTSLGYGGQHGFQRGTGAALTWINDGEVTPEQLKTHIFWIYARMQMAGARVLRNFVQDYVSDLGFDSSGYVDLGYIYHGGSLGAEIAAFVCAIDPYAQGATYGGSRPRDIWGPYGRDRIRYLDDYSKDEAPPEESTWCDYNLVRALDGDTLTQRLASKYFHETRYRELYENKLLVDRSGTHDTHYSVGTSRDFYRRGVFDPLDAEQTSFYLHPIYLFNTGHGMSLTEDLQKQNNVTADRELGASSDENVILAVSGQRTIPRVFVKDVQFDDPDTGDGLIDVTVTAAIDPRWNRKNPGLPPWGDFVDREVSLFHAESADRYFGAVGQQGGLREDFNGSPPDLFRREIFSAEHDNVALGFDPSDIAAADLDGDGDLDLAIADRAGSLEIYLNDGDANFTADGGQTVAGEPVAVATSDFDGDGETDLAAADSTNGQVVVFLNTGSGLGSGSTYSAGTEPVSVTAADLNGDMNVDLVLTDKTGGNVEVLLNNGNGTFGTASSYSAGSEPVSVVAADLTGDQIPDLAVADQFNGNILVLTNAGSGTFGSPSANAAGTSPVSVATADFDGDGDQDLVSADKLGDMVHVLLNNGAGTFASAAGYSVADSPVKIVTVDVDGEGDTDIAVVCEGDDTVTVLRNLWNNDLSVWQGLGSRADFDAPAGPASLAVANLDGLADVDMATVSSPAGTLKIRRCSSMVQNGTENGFELWEGKFTMTCGMQTAFIVEIREKGFTYDPRIIGSTSEVHIIEQVSGACDEADLSGFPSPWPNEFPTWTAICP